MIRCNNCLIPNTKPGIRFNDDGICQACVRAEQKKDIDYDARFKELEELCDKYRRNHYYDCIITVSGGKDSYFQTYTFKEKLGMNPLLVRIADPFTKTKAGIHNIQNLTDVFGCDLLTIDISPQVVRKTGRIAFEQYGRPTWILDRAIYCTPLMVALEKNIPLIVYGENVSYEYGGLQEEETYSARNQINNNVAPDIPNEVWEKGGVTKQELDIISPLALEDMERLEPIYLSYFCDWNGYKNYELAKSYGFMDLSWEWHRKGYIEHYDQIDSVGYLLGAWMKYPKFGFQRVTDVVGYWRRAGMITKNMGRTYIESFDHILDERIRKDACRFLDYNEKEFWDIVERFYNKDIFYKKDGKWVLK